jgi:hypothetical protein
MYRANESSNRGGRAERVELASPRRVMSSESSMYH